MRRLLALAVLVLGPLLYLARRRDVRRERVRVYYDDGSMVTLEQRGPQAERLLGIARTALS
jgi:hypothetical protein